MPKPPILERFYLQGPAGRLEAILESPADAGPAGAALVLHPHPQHGGTMHNKVVHTLARAFVRSGFAALRFNFRGTESSDGEYDRGVGELDDALAAVAWVRRWMASKHVNAPFWLAGFSFGAAIAVRASLISKPDGLVSVAPAALRFLQDHDGQPECRWLIVQGDADELVAIDDTIDWVNNLRPGPELLVMQGAEHFFHGKLVDLREAVSEFITRDATD